MCRNIRPLHNFEPAASDEEIRGAALLGSLTTKAPPTDREVEAEKARVRAAQRHAA